MASLMDELDKRIRDKMRKVVRGLSETTLEYAKIKIPQSISSTMKTNILKSGYVKERGDSWEVGFTHPDAEVLESGRASTSFSGTYIQRVKRHRRKTKNGATNVRQHKRVYSNHRPRLIDNKWYMVDSTPKINATKWLEKSANKIFKNEKTVAEEIKFQFERG